MIQFFTADQSLKKKQEMKLPIVSKQKESHLGFKQQVYNI